ncbi:MAG: phosphodiester glycosidase family protein, partial [Candidatus Eremiobacteraeota bacterium]|nr:phosphodiester glycosidase family protein [Candidatus Eremiobacteraeota bacterium]
MSHHRVYLFPACAVFTACLCAALAGAVRGATYPQVPPDIDGVLSFETAHFVQPAGWPLITAAARAKEPLGPGVDFERWRLATAAGPLSVSLVRVDLRNPYVALQVATRYDRIVGPGEALSTMAERHNAVAGINADYYDISGNGEPTNLVLARGVVQHAPNGRAALLVGDGNRIAMGPATWTMSLTGSSGASLNIDDVNDWSHGSQLMLFTQSFGMPGEADAAAEISLTPASGGGYTVTHAVSDDLTFLPLAPDDLGVAARGSAAVALLHGFHEGDTVTIAQTLTPQIAGLREGVGGGPVLLRNGDPYEDPDAPSPEERDVRYPLTGAGTSADGSTLWLVTVDGRAPARSVGVTRPMFGALFAALGAADAMAFDSGGSTEMVIRRLGDDTVTVANVPSDGRERSIADGLFVVNTAQPGPPTRLVMRASSPAVLVGSHLDVTARIVDAHDQPVPFNGALEFSATPANAATVDAKGVLVAREPGPVTVAVRAGDARGELQIDVVSHVDTLRIANVARAYAPSAQYVLDASASRADGSAIAVDRDAVHWTSSGNGGRLEADGTFTTSNVASRTDAVARVGGAQAAATLLVGAHQVVVAGAMLPGDGAGRWHLVKSPSDLAATMDASHAPDGSAALHLSFDFGRANGTRAAFLENDIPLAGEPLI